MARTIGVLPRMAIFLAGIAAGAVTIVSRRQSCTCAAAAKDLQTGLANLENRLASQESAYAERFNRLEKRVDEHAVRLGDIPSTTQIIGAMEELLSKTITPLDYRLVAQAKTIDTLRSAVSQTDNLLGQVLESLDSLRVGIEPDETPDEPAFSRPLA